MGTSSNLEGGDAEIYFNGTSLGFLMGGSKVKFDSQWLDLTADQLGSTAIDAILTGMDLTLELNIAEITSGNIAKAISASRFDSATSDSKVGFGRSSGFSATSVAKQLQLHPRKYGTIDTN